MVYDYRKLLGRIVEVFGKQQTFALAMGLSERSMSLKLNNKRDFRQSEIKKACNLLGIPAQDIATYFLQIMFNIEQTQAKRKGAKTMERELWYAVTTF